MDQIEDYKEKVNSALKAFLSRKLGKDKKYSPHVKKLIENIIEYNLRGGKRIRPITLIFGYKCFKDDEKIVDASICIELMQAYLLIHDDIIDNADLRRGKLSMHKIYGKQDRDFGVSMAILAGNLCANYVYESILESAFSDSEKIKAINYLAWVVDRENYGQALDLIPGFENLTEEDVWRIYELKTATYTMQGPLYIGATLANASKEQIALLQKYAYNIGVAFQIQDDIIGIFGNVEETGKPNDSDIKGGKKTLLIAKTLEMCGKKEKEIILKKYGKKNVSEADVEEIRRIMEKSGGLDYCKKKMNELVDEGKASITDSGFREEGKEFLLEMADYIRSLV